MLDLWFGLDASGFDNAGISKVVVFQTCQAYSWQQNFIQFLVPS